MKTLGDLKLTTRMIIHFVASFTIVVVFMALLVLPTMQKSLRHEVNMRPRDVTEAIFAVVKGYDAMVESKAMTMEEAQGKIMKAFSLIRYGDDNSGYIAIADLQGKILMHPLNKSLEGVDMSTIKLPDGNSLGDIILGGIRSNPSSDNVFVRYPWELKDLGVVMKTSYVKVFRKWNWLLLSGVYETTIDEAIFKVRMAFLGFIFAASLVITITNVSMGRAIRKSVESVVRSIKGLASGDLHTEISHVGVGGREFKDIKMKMDDFRDTTKKTISVIQRISGELASSAEEMSATTSSFADSAQSQAASIEEISSAIEEITANSEQTAHLAEEYRVLALSVNNCITETEDQVKTLKGVLDTAETGRNELNRKIAAVADTVKATQDTISRLLSQAKEVENASSYITDIADQVNLLSLNAAIEAARAGEHGRGFAVVASEIGKLSNQAQDTVKTVSNLVLEVKDGITSTAGTISGFIGELNVMLTTLQEFGSNVKVASDLSKTSSELQKKASIQVSDMSQHMENLTNAIVEQKIALGEITNTVAGMNERVQAQASGSEQMAASSEEVAKTAESLAHETEFFKCDSPS